MSIFLFMFGYRSLRASQSQAGEILNICMRNGFVYRSFEFCGEYICFNCTYPTSKKLIAECAKRGIPITTDKGSGFPDIFRRYRRRFGVVAGVLIFAAIVFFSGRVVWDIRVEGNERLSDKEIRETLAACGFGVGSSKNGLDIGALENRIMIYSDDISWISVNIIGTVAEVEVREFERQDADETESYDASNIIASEDGFIELYEEVRGNILVDIGDFVRKGELIVSGIYDSNTVGYRYTRARGKVYAKVTHDFEIEIPLSYDKKVYTGREWAEKYLIFFEKEVKIFANTGNLTGMYDTIESTEYFNVLSGGDLPVGIRTVRYAEYEYEKSERSYESAAEIARYKLGVLLSDFLADGDLLRKSVTVEMPDGKLILKCKIECVRNIAEIQEIIIEEIN